MINFGTRIQMVRESDPGYDTTTKITSAKNVIDAVRPFYEHLDREAVTVLALDTKHRIAAVQVVSVGTLNGSTVHPREVYKTAILANAAAIIIVHNHPSGELTPSPDDIAITRRIRKAGEILGIELLDHVIINDECTDGYAMREGNPEIFR